MNNLKNTYSDSIDFKYIIDTVDGNEVFLIKLLKTIGKSLKKYPQLLNQHFQEKEWKNLKATAHKFKSSVVYLEMATFDNILNEIEKFDEKGIAENQLLGLIEKVQQLAIEVGAQVDSKVEELTL
ncbi:hypothetical protein [Flexithrix dorotheae]|uniref:hypothetical protein n=1 Tax=Flexithrix dorotheae TaxID=70993 RepID=UPI000361CFC1|nr:hypothetical protein [Flexithrix dorotheae]